MKTIGQIFNEQQIVITKTDLCPTHGQTEFSSIMGRDFVCMQCEMAKIEAEQAKQRREQFFELKHQRMYNAGINPNGVMFDGWQFDSHHQDRQQRLLKNLQNYANHFNHKHPNILMIGGTGTGKTLLANAIAKAVFDRLYTGDGVPVKLIKTADFSQQAKASWSDSSQPTENMLIAGLGRLDLLVLDDLGDGDTGVTDKLATADRLRFGQLIDKRYQKAPTIITTNLTLPQVKAFLGDRAWDRLAQSLIVVECNWLSYRQVNARVVSW